MAKLGRITGASDVPRGPDVTHRVRVPRLWLEHGAAIELDLPRNLCCANCGGGGCDACERSGAVSLRGRSEPVEIVQVTLPKRGSELGGEAVTLRIPECGGLSAPGSELPRGLLLLSVLPAESADPGVRLSSELEPESSVRPAEVSAGRAASNRAGALATLAVGLLVGALVAWLVHFWAR